MSTALHTIVELDEVLDFSLNHIILDDVVDLDEGVWVPDGAAIVCDKQGHCVQCLVNFGHLAQLVLKQTKEYHQ